MKRTNNIVRQNAAAAISTPVPPTHARPAPNYIHEDEEAFAQRLASTPKISTAPVTQRVAPPPPRQQRQSFLTPPTRPVNPPRQQFTPPPAQPRFFKKPVSITPPPSTRFTYPTSNVSHQVPKANIRQNFSVDTTSDFDKLIADQFAQLVGKKPSSQTTRKVKSAPIDDYSDDMEAVIHEPGADDRFINPYAVDNDINQNLITEELAPVAEEHRFNTKPYISNQTKPAVAKKSSMSASFAKFHSDAPSAYDKIVNGEFTKTTNLKSIDPTMEKHPTIAPAKTSNVDSNIKRINRFDESIAEQFEKLKLEVSKLQKEVKELKAEVETTNDLLDKAK
jgi:hypothetical protein